MVDMISQMDPQASHRIQMRRERNEIALAGMTGYHPSHGVDIVERAQYYRKLANTEGNLVLAKSFMARVESHELFMKKLDALVTEISLAVSNLSNNSAPGIAEIGKKRVEDWLLRATGILNVKDAYGFVFSQNDSSGKPIQLKGDFDELAKINNASDLEKLFESYKSVSSPIDNQLGYSNKEWKPYTIGAKLLGLDLIESLRAMAQFISRTSKSQGKDVSIKVGEKAGIEILKPLIAKLKNTQETLAAQRTKNKVFQASMKNLENELKTQIDQTKLDMERKRLGKEDIVNMIEKYKSRAQAQEQVLKELKGLTDFMKAKASGLTQTL